MPDQKTKRSRLRNAAFSAISLVLVMVVCEALAFLGLSLKAGEVMSPTDIREKRSAAAGEGSGLIGTTGEVSGDEWFPQHAIHPFIGYVLDKNFMPTARRKAGGDEALSYGFSLVEPLLFHQPKEDSLIVGVTGGSLAFNFAQHMAPTLRSMLGDAFGLLPEDIVIVDIALPGFKQPQQLMTLNYLLSLGFRLDVLVNIDGYNEIALPPMESLPYGVAASYPRGWRFRVADFDQQTRLSMADLAQISRRRLRLAQIFDGRLLRSSFIAGLTWSLLDGRQETRAGKIEQILASRNESGEQSLSVSGPERAYANDKEYLDDLVSLWSRSSRIMDGVCRSVGITYLHFIQPNQYLPGSKPMGPEEAAKAYNPSSRYGRWVAMGFPLLIEKGLSLRENGVRFFDISMLFADVDEPVYIDTCCHLNELGETKLAEVVVEAIAANHPSD